LKLNSLSGISFEENKEQQELVSLMTNSDTQIVFCFGKAGTGKTFTSVATAIYLDTIGITKKYKKIFYIREPIEVGKSLGFLPGDLDDKYGVYLDGLKDNIDHISTLSGRNFKDMMSIIECVPPQFVRGRSFENAIILVDEAQNLTMDTIQALSTRLGKHCKLVLLGSIDQIDTKGMNKCNNDFYKSYEILEDLSFVKSVTLTKSERSKYSTIVDTKFTNYKESLLANKEKESLVKR